MTTENHHHASGYDAPVHRREDDLLDRYQLAREIFHIATKGPLEWSVRVGVYGEWGSGKTTVLDMVHGMAVEANHVAIRFNPWGFSDSRGLWHSFIETLQNGLKAYAKSQAAIGGRSLKGKAFNWLQAVSRRKDNIQGAANDRSVGVALHFVELVKDWFAYGAKDMEALLAEMDGKRVIVTIDDLDRTNGAVIPEIFYALKEVMDKRGFSFICGFDPKVVGAILKEGNVGFGDGIRFLDKIIDFPRWLPVPSEELLTKLAVRDASTFCPFVPASELEEVIPLLPANPRAIRQFVRILALLAHQVERHHPHELHWASILVANVLKVRHPRLSHPLLQDKAFWEQISVAQIMAHEKPEEVSKLADAHVAAIEAAQQETLPPEERKRVVQAMKSLCSHIYIWSSFGPEELSYQMHVAERPYAVTWKEFDALEKRWNASRSLATIEDWLKNHSKNGGRAWVEVYQETVDAARKRYAERLDEIASVLDEAERPQCLASASSSFELLSSLVLSLGGIETTEGPFDAARFGALFTTLARTAGDHRSSAARSLRVKEEELLCEIVSRWAPESESLIEVLKPEHSHHALSLDSVESRSLHKKLCALVLPKFARELLERFNQGGAISGALNRRETKRDAFLILFNSRPALWVQGRAAVIDFFQRERANKTVRENLFDFLHWIEAELREPDSMEAKQSCERLLADAEIAALLWEIMVSQPLSLKAVAWLQNLPAHMKKQGTTVSVPDWWSTRVDEINATRKKSRTDQPADETTGN